MTLNEIAYTILKRVQVVLSDDSNLTVDNVKHDVNTERAEMIRREMNKGVQLHEVFNQDLGCIELETVDAAECCGITTPCTVVRTKVKIPMDIKITRVGPIVKTKTKFKFVTYDEAVVSGNGKFTKNDIFSFRIGDYIYLKSNNSDIANYTHINIRGIFEIGRAHV